MAPERELTFGALPQSVVRVLRTLAEAGHEAVLVGGIVRDRVAGWPLRDWDAATSARPEEVAALFPGASWENRFGTVTVTDDPPLEITSYRREGPYEDARRPSTVSFDATLHDDLSRRDFTVNAMAWRPIDLATGTGRLVDPFGGQADLAGRTIRTVGDPRQRIAEDALRLVRAARFAARFGMTIEPETAQAIRDLAPSAAGLSGERVRDELLRILELEARPSNALRLLEELGLLAVILPEVAALRGIPQSKPIPGDALDHTFRTVDAAPSDLGADLRLAALLHDAGKARTMRGGHFIGHELVGAELAAAALSRLRVSRARADRIVAAIHHHMYAYEPTWTDAAVRRFIRRTADVDRDLLFALHRADNRASGAGALGDTNQDALEARVATELERQPDLLVHRRLAVDGHDLQEALGLAPGPELGAILDRLTDAVIEDPALNERAKLLALARQR